MWSLTLIAAPRNHALDSISTSPQWQSTCCNLSGLARPLLTHCPSAPFPLLMAVARQQRWQGAKMINSDWQALGVGLMDTWEITRTVASNTVRIDHYNQSPNIHVDNCFTGLIPAKSFQANSSVICPYKSPMIHRFSVETQRPCYILQQSPVKPRKTVLSNTHKKC